MYDYLLEHPPKDVQEMLQNDKDFIYDIEQNTGLKNPNLETLNNLFEKIEIEGRWHLTQPQWATPEYMNLSKKYRIRHFQLMTENKEMLKLRIGPLITEILDSMLNMTLNNKPRPVMIYSGHDSTVSALVKALNIDEQLPRIHGYAATVAIELHQVNSKWEIRVSSMLSLKLFLGSSNLINNFPYFRSFTMAGRMVQLLPMRLKFHSVCHPALSTNSALI